MTPPVHQFSHPHHRSAVSHPQGMTPRVTLDGSHSCGTRWAPSFSGDSGTVAVALTRALAKEHTARAMGRKNRVEELELQFRETLAKCCMFAQLQGARIDTEPVRFSMSDVLKTTLKKAVEYYGSKVPTTRAGQLNLIDKFWFGEPFFVTKAASKAVENKVREAILNFAERGGQADPTAIVRQAGQFSDSYARTVFRTNVSRYFNRGRVLSAQDNKNVWGFQFFATPDSDVRSNHLAGHRFSAPKEHEVWMSHTPPLGFNCRCTLRPVTFAEAKVKGYDDSPSIPGNWEADRADFGHTLKFKFWVPRIRFNAEFEQKHPRAKDGRFGDKEGEAKPKRQRRAPREKRQSERAKRAKAAYVPATAKVQRAADSLEQEVATALGGKLSGDNKPMDLTIEVNGYEVGIELKGFYRGKGSKIGMRPESRRRKEAWLAEKKNRMVVTVAIDNRDSWADGEFSHHYSGHKVWATVGVGAFRFKGMEPLKSIKAIKKWVTSQVSMQK